MNGSDGQNETPDPRLPMISEGRPAPAPGEPPPNEPAGQLLPGGVWRASPDSQPRANGGYGGSSSRPVHLPLLAELLPGINWSFWSFVVVIWVAGSFGLEDGAWIAACAWLASGVAVLWRPLEEFLAKVIFGLRRPTMAEDARLVPIWRSVASRANLDPTAYELWIQDSDEISAVATSGHTVAVTSWSLYTLPASHLEAVLAHESAHHLGGRPLLGVLGLWYSLPARAALALLRLLFKLMRAVPVLGCLVAGFLLLAYLGVMVAMVMFHESLLTPLLYFTPVLAAPILAWLNRWNERNADKAATDLGYGPRLIEVFYGWQARRHDSGRTQQSPRSGLLSPNPQVAERIRSVERLVLPQPDSPT
jgi:Zn-dependent protease with chaperone function